MKNKIHITLIALFLLGNLLACRLPIQLVAATPTLEKFAIRPSITPQPTDTLTPTPEPSVTPTFTPTQTETPQATVTPTLTALPRSLQMSVFEDLWRVIDGTYVYPDFNGVDWDAVHTEFRQRIDAGLDNAGFYEAMSEMVTRLGDNHSFYLSPEAVAEDEAEFAGQNDYAGIGVYVSAVPERSRAVILAVFRGSPAETAGLQPRDAIISVDGTPILDEDGFLRNIVRGPVGTSITILVQTPGEEPREVVVTRQRITGETPVTYSVITSPEGLRIGYILMVTFADATVDDQVEAALRAMTAEGPLDGLVLDNRMNSGGSSEVVTPILEYFTQGVLGYYVSRDDERPLTIHPNDINGSQTVPLVVLVGLGSASYGEVFPGVLQDSGRAHVIGVTTDGNVEVLWGYDFDDGSQVWIASETFRPYNHPEQNWEASGIIPDETVPGDFDENTLENDPPVIAAMDYFDQLP